VSAPTIAVAGEGTKPGAGTAAATGTPGTDAGIDFARGQRAFAAGDYRAAALSFEDAYRRKPHHAALWNAGRSWERAGEIARAANLYARYLAEAPADARDRDHATEALRHLGAQLVRLDVQGAEDGSVSVDGRSIEGQSVYVSPGDHIVEGRVRGELVRRTAGGVVGGAFSVALEPAPVPTLPPNGRFEPPPSKLPSLSVPSAVAIGAGVLTVVAGGLTLWSGLDTLEKRDAFFEGPTRDKLEDGRDRQLRTNILIGATAAFGIVTAVAALFIDWRGGKAGALRVAPTIATGGGGIVVSATSR
jgi:hypothetical protein